MIDGIIILVVVLSFFLIIIPVSIVQVTKNEKSLFQLIRKPWSILIIVLFCFAVNTLVTYVSKGFYVYYLLVVAASYSWLMMVFGWLVKRQMAIFRKYGLCRK